MNLNVDRRPAGTPTGGQFANRSGSAPSTSLSSEDLVDTIQTPDGSMVAVTSRVNEFPCPLPASFKVGFHLVASRSDGTFDVVEHRWVVTDGTIAHSEQHLRCADPTSAAETVIEGEGCDILRDEEVVDVSMMFPTADNVETNIRAGRIARWMAEDARRSAIEMVEIFGWDG